jgi:sortase A
MNRQKGKTRSRGTFITVLIFLIGVGLFMYPSVSDYWNSFHQSRAIMSYADRVANMEADQYQDILANAEKYNRNLAKTGVIWNMTDEEAADYNRQLDFNETGIMGYITIDKINVILPIYHGTSDAVLQTSIGHLEGTSLPVGGENTHTVLSGHRGLPSARLFTDLDKLTEGDTFSISILNETLTYEVDQIRIVEPTDLSNLQIEDGRDYCTLVTCTPLGINTHRLLVRGHRIANVNGDADVTADALQIRPLYIMPFVMAPMVVLLIVFMLIRTRHRRKYNFPTVH